MKNYICKIAELDEINRKWDYEISQHPDDNSWVVWKESFIEGVKSGNRICYYGILDGEIISEATAMFSADEIQNGDGLVDEETVYLSAFRTVEKFQGQGYFSRLYKYMEEDLKSRGYKALTLGVEPNEIKNMKIYFNWGFENYIKTAYETYPPKDRFSQPQEIMVNYYSKKIK